MKISNIGTGDSLLSKNVTKVNDLELSNFDIEVLKSLPDRYDWLVRTNHGSLYLYKGEEPYRFREGTIWLTNTDTGTYLPLNGVLNGLTFDSKPLNLLETLKSINHPENNN